MPQGSFQDNPLYGTLLIVALFVCLIVPFLLSFFTLFCFLKPSHAFWKNFPLIVFCTFCLSWIFFSYFIWIVDVANRNLLNGLGIAEGLDILVKVVTFVQSLVIYFVTPGVLAFSLFHDNKARWRSVCCKQLACGFCCILIVNLVILGTFGVTFPFIGYVDMPLDLVKTSSVTDPSVTLQSSEILLSHSLQATSSSSILIRNSNVKTSRAEVPIFYNALALLGSWIVFIPLIGVGITAIPLDFLSDFIWRPTRLRLPEYQRLREYSKTRAEKLMLKGADMEDRKEEGNLRSWSPEYLRFKREVQNLKEEWAVTHFRFINGGISVWKTLYILAGFLVTAPLSILWLLHMILYMSIQPKEYRFFGFLDDLVYYADKLTGIVEDAPEVPLFGALLMTLLAGYLIACLITGFFKLTRMIPFLYLQYPRIRDSDPFDLLAVVLMLFVCDPALKQFCFYSFEKYLEHTSVAHYYNLIEHIFVLGHVYRYLIYAVLLGIIIGLLFNSVVLCCGQRFRRATKQERTKAFLNASTAPAGGT